MNNEVFCKSYENENENENENVMIVLILTDYYHPSRFKRDMENKFVIALVITL